MYIIKFNMSLSYSLGSGGKVVLIKAVCNGNRLGWVIQEFDFKSHWRGKKRKRGDCNQILITSFQHSFHIVIIHLRIDESS